MSNPVKLVIDLSKPEGQREAFIPMTDEEIAERQVRLAKAEEQRLAEEQAQAERAAARKSAEDKLAALGLTPEEISAMLG